MAVSINNYLNNLSLSYYLKNDSAEVGRINTSLSNLLGNLDKELGPRIKRRFVFGSYDRDTILPRKFDSKSDVDLMVIFNHTEYERTPDTYRSWLKSFADKCYKNRYGSKVENTFPTVSIRLNNIYYDLVPAKEEKALFSASSTIYIPDVNGWRETDPNDVKQKLIAANTRYNQVVRPIIRLLKGWNCYNNYPFDSYLLELNITDMSFYNDNIQSGLFGAIDRLSTWNDSQTKKDKIKSLQYNISQVKTALQNDDFGRAKQWLHKVLPYP